MTSTQGASGSLCTVLCCAPFVPLPGPSGSTQAFILGWAIGRDRDPTHVLLTWSPSFLLELWTLSWAGMQFPYLFALGDFIFPALRKRFNRIQDFMASMATE